MTKRLLVSLISTLLIATLLVACGSRPDTLRAYMDANPDEWEEAQEEAAAEAAEMSAMFGVEMASIFEIVGDHELVMNFKFTDADLFAGTDIAEILALELTAELESMMDFYTDLAIGMRRAMRIDTLYYTLRYLDADGNVLAELTVPGH